MWVYREPNEDSVSRRRNYQLELNAADRVKKIRSEQYSINPEFQGNEDN